MLARSRLLAGLVLLIAVLLLVQYVRVWLSIPTSQARTSDFAGTYAASTLWREGHAASMYDEAAERQVLIDTGTPVSHSYIPYENPPLASVLAAPVSLLDSASAYRVWSLLEVGLVLAAVLLAARVAPWPRDVSRLTRAAVAATAMAGIGTALVLLQAQWDGPLVLAMAIAYAAWRTGNGALGGVAVGVAAAVGKPHLAIGVAAFMLGRRDWRALAGLAGGAAATVLAGWIAAGPTANEAFLGALLKPSNNPLVYMQGVSGLVASWLGGSGSALALTAVISAAALSTAWWLGAISRRDARAMPPAFCGACIITLLAAPHLLSHDLSVLAPAFVIWCAWLAQRGAAPAVALVTASWWVLLSLASQQDLGNAAPAPPGRLTPLVLLAGAVACSAAAHVAHATPHRVRLPFLGNDADASVRLEHA